MRTAPGNDPPRPLTIMLHDDASHRGHSFHRYVNVGNESSVSLDREGERNEQGVRWGTREREGGEW